MSDDSLSRVLDHGYVKLISNMGSDKDVVNAARASYAKEVSELDDKDIKLINFLIKHKHDSTLRHCAMTFEVHAPLMIARQWWKHVVSSTHLDDQEGWNESSRRYITEEPVFYLPKYNEWRSAPDNNKQGSGDIVNKDTGVIASSLMEKHIDKSVELYEEAMNRGIAPEQARLFLPAYAMYVRWRWTTSLNAVLNFLALRKGEGAQTEITEYANAISDLIEPYYPETMFAWNYHRL